MDFVWYMDGGSIYVEGVQYTGLATIVVGRTRNVKQVVQGKCHPHSVQAAEVVAVAAALESTPCDYSCVLYSDSKWVIRALLDWPPLWKMCGYLTLDGKPVKLLNLL